MVRATWDQLTAGLSPADLELYAAFRDKCRALPDTKERVHRTEVQYAAHRVMPLIREALSDVGPATA
jgi:hypothetical protein